MKSSESRGRYRRDIDGLRAVAVVSVLMFHVGLGFPGGFVGVDVFFVISGFLIYSILLRDLSSESFSFLNFWERRARRIAPALIVSTLATVIAGWFLLLPEDYADLGVSLIYQSAMAANIYFWQESGYFAAPAEVRPLLHNWSLAVEEQFYIFFPILLFLIDRSRKLKTKLPRILGLGLLVSFLLSVLALGDYPEATFFLLPSRAWELLLGACLAHYPKGAVPRKMLYRQAFGLLAVVLIAVPVFYYSKSTSFPGAAALAPCFGTAIIIALGMIPGLPETFVSRLLSTRVFVSIGIISYSLYLWHWPMIAYLNYWRLGETEFAEQFAVVLGSFALAYLSWRYVETPFRTRQICASQSSIYLFAGSGIVVLLVAGCWLRLSVGAPDRFSDETIRYAAFSEDREFIKEHKLADIREGALTEIGSKEASAGDAILVWGDSHAMAAMPGFDAYFDLCRIKGLAVTRSSTPPVLGYYNPKSPLRERSRDFNSEIFSFIQREHIRKVVLVGRWSYYLGADRSEDLEHSFDFYLIQTVKELRRLGVAVWVLREAPAYRVNVPRALAWSTLTGSESRFSYLPTESSLQWWEKANLSIRLKEEGAIVLDPLPWLRNPGTNTFRTHDGQSVFYSDKHHLSATGARKVILPMLRATMDFDRKP